MASERQINSLPGLLAIKMIRQQISLTNGLTHQSTKKRRQWWNRAEHRSLKNGTPLMRGLFISKNIPVSVPKPPLSLRVGFISSHLTAVKLFPVITRAISGPPNMSLLLEVISMPVLIVKPRLNLLLSNHFYRQNITKSNWQSNKIQMACGQIG